MNINQTQRAKTRYAGKTAVLKMAEMEKNPFFMQTYGEVAKYAKASNQQLGVPVAIYKTWDMEKGEAETMVAFVVEEGFDPGELEVFETDAEEVVAGMHVGPYSALGTSHQKIMEHVQVMGKTPRLAIEEYLNDPSTTPSAELQTRIVYYLSK